MVAKSKMCNEAKMETRIFLAWGVGNLNGYIGSWIIHTDAPWWPVRFEVELVSVIITTVLLTAIARAARG
jgi:hypothetical protein